MDFLDSLYTLSVTIFRTQVPYILWKTDNNAKGKPSSIYIRAIAENGIKIEPDSTVTKLLTSSKPSDSNIVEGPWIVFKNNFYYLFFSSDRYSSPNYHSSVARSDNILGPYTRLENSFNGSILHTANSNTFLGSGHGSVVYLEESKEWWYVYHSWRKGKVKKNPPGRVMNLDRIVWENDWPWIGCPTDTEVPMPTV